MLRRQLVESPSVGNAGRGTCCLRGDGHVGVAEELDDGVRALRRAEALHGLERLKQQLWLILFEGDSHFIETTAVAVHAERARECNALHVDETALESFCKRRMDPGIVDAAEHPSCTGHELSPLRLDEGDQCGHQAAI
ncbi:MAG: hypothetical protein JRF54_10890, partial [Deltaproteobacteria bacterium]|nr:hypothetical protein [Deltaproteobacteria bacterium]